MPTGAPSLEDVLHLVAPTAQLALRKHARRQFVAACGIHAALYNPGAEECHYLMPDSMRSKESDGGPTLRSIGTYSADA
jgi:hypothetical protein